MGGPGSGARPREYPPEVVELACRLYESGLSVKQVQRHIPGFRAQTILTRYLPNLRPSGLQAKGAPSYKTLHSRLSRTRGRAAEHTCVDCGGPAAAWSYNNNDPDELTETQVGGSLVAYSINLANYDPRCTPCHSRFDGAGKWRARSATGQFLAGRKSKDKLDPRPQLDTEPAPF